MTRRVALIACALLVVACSDNNEVCHDGVDNDNDTLADCADEACAGASCGPNGLVCGTDQKCSACSGNGGAAEAAEATCGDGFDNDCDGKIDCADPDCQPADGASGKVCDELGRTCSAPDALGRSVCGTSGTGGGGGVSLSYIRLISAEYDVLGARGSGYQEQSLLTFEVRGSRRRKASPTARDACESSSPPG